MWRSLNLTMLQAEYRTERACELPEYLGSTVRGAFGEELRRSCLESDAPCASCHQPDRCACGALFDGPGDGEVRGIGMTAPTSGASAGIRLGLMSWSRRRGGPSLINRVRSSESG